LLISIKVRIFINLNSNSKNVSKHLLSEAAKKKYNCADLFQKKLGSKDFVAALNARDFLAERDIARTYLQLPLRQWGAGNVYLLVFFSC
jgi:hypothetical protein